MIISDKRYEPATLHKLWNEEMEILNVIDVFCKNHHIKYSISYGTLLGAVRHKGFIPWDDDIDIMMLREDYNRFREIWLQNPPKGYVFVDDTLYDECNVNFAKIRKENSTFIQFEYEYNFKSLPLGIFVDIFVFDRVAPEGLPRKKQYFYSLVNMLFTRNHPSGSRGFPALCERFLLSFPVGFQLRMKNRARRYIEKWNSNEEALLANFCTLAASKRYLPANMFDNIIDIEFENRRYSAVAIYDEVLKIFFGDYMQLPPENQRASHYPLLLDFEHSWKDINKTN